MSRESHLGGIGGGDMKGPGADVDGPKDLEPHAGGGLLTVMTRNLCHGADLRPILTADRDEFASVVAKAFDQAKATDFPGRARAWADEIERARPDLIGLQEAAIFRTQSPPQPPPPSATQVDTDFLDLLLSELRARNVGYEKVIAQPGQDIELPGWFPPDFVGVRLTHQEVILARTDALTWSNARGGLYPSSSSVTLGGMKTDLPWAWAAVDATMHGRSFRFATTHLDPDNGDVQLHQADEFIDGPGTTDLPLIWVGDFNSDANGTTFTNIPPSTGTYGHIIERGFSDAWRAKYPTLPGYTCCQATDLLNTDTLLDTRVDLVLTRGEFTVVEAIVVGADPQDRLQPSGLWPSDHAGVVVTLQL
jgi:Endonuclease/Exonuclease/phosphatase family